MFVLNILYVLAKTLIWRIYTKFTLEGYLKSYIVLRRIFNIPETFPVHKKLFSRTKKITYFLGIKNASDYYNIQHTKKKALWLLRTVYKKVIWGNKMFISIAYKT